MKSGKIKIALISGGMIANAAHIPAYRNMQDFAEIVAVCDIYEPAAQTTAQRWEIPNTIPMRRRCSKKKSRIWSASVRLIFLIRN